MGDRAGLAGEVAGLGEQLDDPRPGSADGQALELPVAALGGRWIVALPPRRAPRQGLEAAVPPDHGPHWQAELPPPDHVGDVAEGADHGDAGALLGIGQLVGDDRHPRPEQRRADLGPEQGLVARVVGMGDQGHAGGKELGPRRLDLDRCAVRSPETQPMVGSGDLAVLQLGLRHGCGEIDVPQRGRLGLERPPPGQQAQEAPLRRPLRPLADGGVGH